MRFHLLVFTLFFSFTAFSQNVRINQLGFKASSLKQAIIENAENAKKFCVKNEEGKVVFKGKLTESKVWVHSGLSTQIADFSKLKEEGSYQLFLGQKESVKFTVSNSNYDNILKASCKAFYLNRASMDLEEEYAGVYARKGGHMDDSVFVHSSAQSATRPEGTVLNSPGGWYDAGDYNKYIVNSGISTYTLLRAYTSFNKLHRSLDLNIPESGNNEADLLSEIEYNIRWMMTMQDSTDGGVYHKLTDKKFSSFDKPTNTVTPRYVVQKSTSAALNFAAVLAYYSNLLQGNEQASVLLKAEQAYAWAIKNPKVYYQQPEDIKTGTYADTNVEDEFLWAKAELLIATQKEKYADLGIDFSIKSEANWFYVKPLAIFSLASSGNTNYRELATTGLLNCVDDLVKHQQESVNGTVMGVTKENFVWGSNAVSANQAMLLIEAYNLTGLKKYKNAALSNLNYLMGQNPLGYCYVTGFGVNSPRYIHHRLSASDGVEAPQPGLLAGGPNYHQQDKKQNITYPSSMPALSYTDELDSYASNEIAINWNSPLVYLLSFVVAE